MKRVFGIGSVALAIAAIAVACVPPPGDDGSTTSTTTATSSTTTTTVPDDPTPVIDPASEAPLPAPTAGTPYAVQLRSDSGADATWEIVSGSLPEGLTVSPTGLISGVPAGPSQLWAVDVRATPAPMSEVRAGLDTASDDQAEQYHLWGWTSEPQEQVPFPVPVAPGADEPFLVVGNGFTSFWQVHPDGSTTQPPLAMIDPLMPMPVPADLVTWETGRHARARSAVDPFAQGCEVDIFDLTQGPSLPIAATVTHSVNSEPDNSRTHCRVKQAGPTLWLTAEVHRGLGQYQTVIDVFDVATAQRLRTVTIDGTSPSSGTGGNILYRADGDRMWLVHQHTWMGTRTVQAIGRTADGDAPAITSDVGLCASLVPWSGLIDGNVEPLFCGDWTPSGGIQTARGVDFDLGSGTVEHSWTFPRSAWPAGTEWSGSAAGRMASGQMLTATAESDPTDPYGTGVTHVFVAGGSAGETPQLLFTWHDSPGTMLDGAYAGYFRLW
jgi:hypothetical protein